MKSFSRGAAVFGFCTAVSAFFAAPALAVPTTTNCPGTASTTDREFSITIDPGTATCFDSGSGNINANPPNQNAQFLNAHPEYALIDKSDSAGGLEDGAISAITGLGGGGGNFSYTISGVYSSIVLALKSGNGQFDPDWFAFLMPTVSSTAVSWTISVNGLSHVNLYGVVGETNTIPLPAAGVLLLTALGGLGFASRRRRAA